MAGTIRVVQTQGKKGPIGRLADAMFLSATDDFDIDRIDPESRFELGYKTAVLNTLEMVTYAAQGATTGTPKLVRPALQATARHLVKLNRDIDREEKKRGRDRTRPL